MGPDEGEEDDDLSNLVDVSQADIMGDPPETKPKPRYRIVPRRRPVPREPPPTSLGGVR